MRQTSHLVEKRGVVEICLLDESMRSIYDLTIKELENYFINNNEKKFKAEQVYMWLYKNRVNSFDEFSNIKKETIELLKKDYKISKLKVIDKRQDDLTVKYLFELEDNNKIEAVLMKHDYGNSLCVSTQVGCNMGCSFCDAIRWNTNFRRKLWDW